MRNEIGKEPSAAGAAGEKAKSEAEGLSAALQVVSSEVNKVLRHCKVQGIPGRTPGPEMWAQTAAAATMWLEGHLRLARWGLDHGTLTVSVLEESLVDLREGVGQLRRVLQQSDGVHQVVEPEVGAALWVALGEAMDGVETCWGEYTASKAREASEGVPPQINITL